MTLDNNTKILIVGLGLMGGSYARALTAAGFEVGAIDTRTEACRYAMEKKIVAHSRDVADPDYIGEFDLLVFALYPHIFLEWIRENQQYIKKGALLTDVTGVKGSVVYAVQEILRKDLEFVGAHPMAGRETSGVENSCTEIFHGANYIVTPTENNSAESVEACKALGRILGFGNITELTPLEHDEMIGFLSQLTHCIAVSLMVCKDTDKLAEYTGDSFRDLTRIAKINDEMWSELFLLNKKQLLRQMELFEGKFSELKQAIASDDTDKMRDMMRLSTLRRQNCEKFASIQKIKPQCGK